MPRICIVGDYDLLNETHAASTEAVEHAALHVGADVDVVWAPTVDITSPDAPVLRHADALLIAPGSPYRNMDGALFAITHARLHDLPLLGTCGGFQHVVVEYARNVLGVRDAEHAESSPDAATHVITPLTCSLFGQRMDVDVCPGTIAFAAYGRLRATERFYCSFGLNSDFADALVAGGLVVSGTDRDGEVRILEHPGMQFFMGTLFVPQTSSTPDAPHPLLVAFVSAAANAKVPSTVKASNEAIA